LVNERPLKIFGGCAQNTQIFSKSTKPVGGALETFQGGGPRKLSPLEIPSTQGEVGGGQQFLSPKENA